MNEFIERMICIITEFYFLRYDNPNARKFGYFFSILVWSYTRYKQFQLMAGSGLGRGGRQQTRPAGGRLRRFSAYGDHAVVHKSIVAFQSVGRKTLMDVNFTKAGLIQERRQVAFVV